MYTPLNFKNVVSLSHAHILVILSAQDKPREPSDYDKIVCAEILDATLTPKLHSIVKRCMMVNVLKNSRKHLPNLLQQETIATKFTDVVVIIIVLFRYVVIRTLTAIYTTLVDTSWCDALSDTAQSVARRVTQYGTVTTQDLEGKCLTLLQDML